MEMADAGSAVSSRHPGSGGGIPGNESIETESGNGPRAGKKGYGTMPFEYLGNKGQARSPGS